MAQEAGPQRCRKGEACWLVVPAPNPQKMGQEWSRGIILRGILLKHVEFTNQVLIIVCYAMLCVLPKSLRRRRSICPCGPGSSLSCRCCSTHGSSDLSLRHVSGACYFLEKWKLYEAMSILFQEKLQQTSKNLEDKTQTCLLSKSKAANKGVAPCWP